MQLIEVRKSSEAKDFLKVNVLMNASNPKYIQPINKEVEEVFDRKKNKAFKYGDITRWVLKDDSGKLVGRIAAFVSSKYTNKGDSFPAGGIGFFDCINDQATADFLFDTAKNWLEQKGMQAMDGPINFLERDKWWGLMVEGFDEEPMYGISFNPPYYQQLFEGYGFKNFYNQYYFSAEENAESVPLSAKYVERYARFAAKPGYEVKHIDKKDLVKFAHDFAKVYNAAWAQHEGGKEMAPEQAVKIFKKMKPVMDEALVWFAYYKGDPIGMWLNIPDLNQYFKYFNGKFGWFEKLRLLILQRTKPSRKMNGVAFGIVPKYQGLGVDAYMIHAGTLHLRKLERYDLIEMGWAGEWNPKMLGIYKAIGGKQSRRMVTYRYIFDPNIPFEKHPVI